MSDLVYPTLTGWVRTSDQPHPTFLNASEPWAADDPFVDANPDLFGEAPTFEPRRSVASSTPPVEQATAAPGEKRAARRAPATRKAAE